MTGRLLRATLALAAAGGIAATVALAQGTEEEETTRLERFLESSLSTPERQVRIRGIDGVLSSTVRIAEVTFSDPQGSWIEIENVTVTWNRLALFRRIVDIDRLEAETVRVLRRPAPGEAEAAAGGEFSLPVSVRVDALSLPDIVVSEPVIGTSAVLSAQGSANIESNVIAASLAVTRNDSPGGMLTADLRLDPNANELTAELDLAEPQGGIVATLLNLPGRPAIGLSLDGEGPLSDWSGRLSLESDGSPILGGDIRVAAADGGHRLVADVTGRLGTFAPAEYASLLQGESRLGLDALLREGGGLDVARADLTTPGLSASAQGRLTADYVPEAGEVRLDIGAQGATTIPFLPGEPTVGRLQLAASLEPGGTAPWTLSLDGADVRTAYGSVASLQASGTGQVTDIANPAGRSATFRLNASLGGVAPADPAVAEALGDDLTLTAQGSWRSGQPVDIAAFDLVLDGATAGFAGTATAAALDGRYTLSATDLSRFSGLAGRDLAGSARIAGTGTVRPAGGLFGLNLEGEASNLDLGIAALDPLVAGTVTLTGGIARGEDGKLTFQTFTVASGAGTATLTGTVADPALDLTVDARVADLATLSDRASGAAALSARVTGTTEAPSVDATLTGESVVLMGRRLADPRATFRGVVAGPQTNGAATLSGNLDGVAIDGAATLAAAQNGARRIENLRVTAGSTRIAGDLLLAASGEVTGSLSVDSPDIAQVAPLLLVDARGAVRLAVDLSAEGGRQSARFEGTMRNVTYETARIGSADISGSAEDLFGVPLIDARFSARDVVAGGTEIRTLSGTARREGNATAIEADAALADGSARLRARLEPQGEALAIRLDAFSFEGAGLQAMLAAPTTVLVQDGGARFDQATLRVGGGSLRIDGRADGRQMALTVAIQSLPAALANGFVSDLGAEGAISGTVTVAGTPAAPVATFEANWQSAALAATRNAGLGPLAVTADGRFADGALALRSRIAGAGGIELAVAGSVDVAAGNRLDLSVTGSAPLALANQQLADRGAQLSGTLAVDVAVRGTAAAPEITGSIRTAGAGFVDPDTGIVLRNLSLDAALTGNQITIRQLTAQSGPAGTLTASGSVGIAAGSGFPVDISATMRNVRYVDENLVVATFDADLTVTGTVAAGPTVGGTVRVARAEITVPEKLPAGSVAIDVIHLYAPPPVEATLERAQRVQGTSSGSPGGGMNLDLTIDAPARIFVRGRGLDAELGGRLRVVGPMSALRTDGAFTLRRGRFDIFTQRLTFDRGTLTFAGDFDPMLDFTATTQAGEVAVTISVTGVASDPEVQFSSVPELPEDEVLAYVLFGRGVDQLSPFQLARLAAAAAQFAGSGGPGILDRLRSATGLDDLDVVTDAQGGVALRAGRYIGENLYFGVEQGTTSESSRATVDLEITDEIKARAQVGAEGNSKIGIYYEREY
ncbi:translocation/assembly module TamB domain-containing protein [Faunimonas sp. B44]|uniref:translocation/assembly module TamB domain-containing protein n=1 Tax=Faunimonas sp. B44 TaxID=3461493 RepID=UPI0040449521